MHLSHHSFRFIKNSILFGFYISRCSVHFAFDFSFRFMQSSYHNPSSESIEWWECFSPCCFQVFTVSWKFRFIKLSLVCISNNIRSRRHFFFRCQHIRNIHSFFFLAPSHALIFLHSFLALNFKRIQCSKFIENVTIWLDILLSFIFFICNILFASGEKKIFPFNGNWIWWLRIESVQCVLMWYIIFFSFVVVIFFFEWLRHVEYFKWKLFEWCIVLNNIHSAQS